MKNNDLRYQNRCVYIMKTSLQQIMIFWFK